MFEKYLKDIGLSDKEAAVYLALLSFDKALVSDIRKGQDQETYYICNSRNSGKKGACERI